MRLQPAAPTVAVRGCRYDAFLPGCVPFLRSPTPLLREERAKQPQTTWRTLSRGFFALFFTLYFFLGVASVHTLLSQTYTNRNPWFAALLIFNALTMSIAALEDCTQVGSPWGIQEQSRIAAVLISFRAIYLVSQTLVFTACAVAASFPPYECVEC